MTNLCPVCRKRILNHAYQISCRLCTKVFHLKCITLLPCQQEWLLRRCRDWYCKPCISYIFPFNHIEDDQDFIRAVNHIDTMLSLNNSDLIFHPFEINDSDHLSPLFEIDPDLHFYNKIYFHLSKCNYYDERSFTKLLRPREKNNSSFSLCHLNIRNMKRILPYFSM